jgi:hypothetical protein
VLAQNRGAASRAQQGCPKYTTKIRLKKKFNIRMSLAKLKNLHVGWAAEPPNQHVKTLHLVIHPAEGEITK